MKQKCEECGDYKDCNDDGVCFDCIQDRFDLEDWLPEHEEQNEEED
jgi:NMD protein affecting ribosome stability and mRNA decay